MSSLMKTLGMDRLPPEERVRLAEELFDSVEREPDPLTEEQLAELERRVKLADAGLMKFSTWYEVRDRVRSRFANQ
jgi:putative addiction module component (TIGR02574 family)